MVEKVEVCSTISPAPNTPSWFASFQTVVSVVPTVPPAAPTSNPSLLYWYFTQLSVTVVPVAPAATAWVEDSTTTACPWNMR